MSSSVKRVSVGIDIGLTCTAVAICTVHDTPDGESGLIKIHQTWPGSNELLNKVPTQVAYVAGKQQPHSWGSSCPELRDLGRGMAIKDMFKFFLDTSFVTKKFQRVPENVPDREDVKWWYGHFLTALYHEVMHELRERVSDVRGTYVEFVFSIPTSWKDNDVVMRDFRDLVDEAGFGDNVVMDLTEAEAAAVFTAHRLDRKFQHGEAFMVCDAGGGTFDMCVLQVRSVQDDIVQLENLDEPKALPIGSVNIDEAAEARIASQLRSIRAISPHEVPDLALEITKGAFQWLKVGFGDEYIGPGPFYSLDVPGTNYAHRIRLSSVELQEMFDEQVNKMIEGIDRQISLLRGSQPLVRLRYLFLAGGLGSSKYVQDRIVDHLRNKEMRVLFAPDPSDLPLAVAKGLLIDRLQNFSKQLPVISIRSSKSSYGILFKEIHSERHIGQRAIKDPLDGKKYAENQIDWLIRKDSNHRRGEIVNRNYSVLVDPNFAMQDFSFSVVRSTLDAKELPDHFDGSGNNKVEIVCHVSSRPEAGLHEIGNAQKRGIIGKRTVFHRVHCKLSAAIDVGKFVFSNTFIGHWDSNLQNLIVHWPKGTAIPYCDLIGNTV